MQTARVFDIHRGTTHDGPGLRTTVFFKGCPLSCEWCQNPEGISGARQLLWNAAKCIKCLSCEAACEQHAISHSDAAIFVDHAACDLGGACVAACPARAMTMSGTEYTLEALTREVLKDRKYFENFDGGVTASGGEPTSQAGFLAEFFKGLKDLGVHTALDTCGLTSRRVLDELLPVTDCVLYDVKFIDETLHRQYTGQSNAAILANLAYIAEHIRRVGGVELWIRTPLIPGATATAANIAAIGRFIAETAGDVLGRWELCAFNILAREKYKKLGAEWTYQGTGMTSRAQGALILDAARSQVPAERVSVTGILAEG
jgi:pyruvate formate lyase activating enzyme